MDGQTPSDGNSSPESLQAANQVLLLFGPIENPRWPPAVDIIQHSDPMGNIFKNLLL
jgi:hypothetical protein